MYFNNINKIIKVIWKTINTENALELFITCAKHTLNNKNGLALIVDIFILTKKKKKNMNKYEEF
jgi:hypothetical protein